jgi:hypothetical protein
VGCAVALEQLHAFQGLAEELIALPEWAPG